MSLTLSLCILKIIYCYITAVYFLTPLGTLQSVIFLKLGYVKIWTTFIIIIIIISRSGHCWPMASPTSISIYSLFLTSRSHLLPSQYHPAIFLLASLYFALFWVSTLYFFWLICHSSFSQCVLPKTISSHHFFP